MASILRSPKSPGGLCPDTPLTSRGGLFLPRYLPMTGKLPGFDYWLRKVNEIGISYSSTDMLCDKTRFG